jgi:hypothetical protein
LASIRTAVNAGADGIFLINQGMSTAQVLAFIPEVARQFASLWIGVNLLGVTPEDVIERIFNLPVRGRDGITPLTQEHSLAIELFLCAPRGVGARRRTTCPSRRMGLVRGGIERVNSYMGGSLGDGGVTTRRVYG